MIRLRGQLLEQALEVYKRDYEGALDGWKKIYEHEKAASIQLQSVRVLPSLSV
jgi:hypothetical protein